MFDFAEISKQKSIVLNTDWRNVSHLFPDKYFDWVVDDIPYGINAANMPYIKSGKKQMKQKNGTEKKLSTKPKYQTYNWDKEPPTQDYFDEMCRISKHQIIFGVDYVNWKNLGAGRIEWNNGVPEGMSFKSIERAYCSAIDYTHHIDLLWSGMRQAADLDNPMLQQGNKKKNQQRIHPTEKPILLYKKLALDFNMQNKKVFCAHNGSGADRIAWDNYIAQFIATEINSEYFMLQEQRYQIFKSHLLLNF